MPIDDKTESYDPGDDETRRIDPDDDATRAMDVDDDATRAMAHDADATRPLSDEPDVTRTMPGAAPSGGDTTRFIERTDAPIGPHTERIYTHDPRPPMTGWVIAGIVVLALLIGGVLGYNNADPSDHNVLKRALVTPAGGTVEFDEGGRIEIPEDALTTATLITVRKEKIERRIRLGAEGDPGTAVYEPGQLEVYVFEPQGLQFQHEVKVIIPRTNNGEALLVDAEQPRVVPGEPKDDVLVVKTMSFGFEQ